MSSAAQAVHSAAPALSRNASAEFHLVREFDANCAYLHSLPEKAFVSCYQDLYVIERDEILSESAFQRGIEREDPTFLWSIGSMTGTWPDNAWLGTNRTTESSAYGEYFHWTGVQWKKIGNAKKLGLALWDLLPWPEQRAVAVVQPTLGFGARLIPLGTAPFAVPHFTRPKLTDERCPTRIQVQVTTVLGPGDIMAAGWACDVQLNRGNKDVVYPGLGVERLRADLPQGDFALLEGLPDAEFASACQVTALLTVGKSEVLLTAHCRVNRDDSIGYFARWQGSSFVQQASPIDGVLNLLWVEQPDVLWATDLQQNLWRQHDGKWTRVAWERPGGEDTEITQGWARGPNDIWLVTRSLSQNKTAVYHGRSAP